MFDPHAGSARDGNYHNSYRPPFAQYPRTSGSTNQEEYSDRLGRNDSMGSLTSKSTMDPRSLRDSSFNPATGVFNAQAIDAQLQQTGFANITNFGSFTTSTNTNNVLSFLTPATLKFLTSNASTDVPIPGSMNAPGLIRKSDFERDSESQKDTKQKPNDQLGHAQASTTLISGKAQQPSIIQAEYSQNFNLNQEFNPPSIEQCLKTVFIGNIPKTLDNVWLEKLLRSVGKLVHWSPGPDSQSGFAEYEDEDHLSRAIECLEDLVLPACPEKSILECHLTLKVDKFTRQYIEEWQSKLDPHIVQRSRNLVPQSRSNLQRTLNAYSEYLSTAYVASKDEEKEEDSQSKEQSELGANNSDNLEPQISSGQDEEIKGLDKEATAELLAEIRAFRERAAKREKDNKTLTAEIEKQKAALESKSITEWQLELKNLELQYITEKKAIETRAYETKSRIDSELLDPGSDDELIHLEEEKAKAAKEDVQFSEEERKWLARERARNLAMEREMKRDIEETNSAQSESFRKRLNLLGMSVADRLASWDDEEEQQKLREEYYFDHAHWTSRRAAFRQKEKDMDLNDRKMSKHRAREFSQIENDNAKVNVTTVHKPAQDIENTNQVATTNEKSIPQDKKSLYSYELPWDMILSAENKPKIRPYVVDRIVEYLGVEEDELVGFVEQHIYERKSADELEKELELAMEDEAGPFVVKLYKYIASL